ncbi:putative beta-lysine N-acetyltransferase [Vallitalea maricola]|uniref:Beta-lysine N-acetyltransferase n=1 Tax=Vallitalea maricola TaxID=3074433 RepID=A0ACB5UGU3_9FIRM|nr:putative beta-lysine N-acetyltransferase [Vallitalea sp. AN17-2]
MLVKKDKEVLLGYSRIQHGPLNDRIYVMDYKHALDPYLISKLDLMVKNYRYGKIIAKVPKEARLKFLRNGFDEEAIIPGFYNGRKPCYFMARYHNEERKKIIKKKSIYTIIHKAKNNKKSDLISMDDKYNLILLNKEDSVDISDVYKQVFKTYPFPIHDEKYIQKTMDEDVVYFGVMDNEKLIGVSSCDMNTHEENVEMTDFAILPEYRGNKLARHLLKMMEDTMGESGIKIAYTIARSTSYPMNATFSAAGYKYGGTLWNNTQIAGSIESMNIWYKQLCNKKSIENDEESSYNYINI